MAHNLTQVTVIYNWEGVTPNK